MEAKINLVTIWTDNIGEMKQFYSGVKGVQPPADMPWNQRTALFSYPDGNIHEIFCELK